MSEIEQMAALCMKDLEDEDLEDDDLDDEDLLVTCLQLCFYFTDPLYGQENSQMSFYLKVVVLML